MIGCASSSFSIVNAEDSMGGVAEGGIGIADDTSPRKVVIKKVQAELRQKYKARNETKRELEFLEKGGNLLDYRLRYVALPSVQSTSVTDLQNDRLVANYARGGVAFVTSSHGYSVETNGGPGVVPSEANSADNLLYFDDEIEFIEGGRSLSHCRKEFIPPKQSLTVNETQNHGDSATFSLPRKAYKRRYRSHPSRKGTRSGSMEEDWAHVDHETSDVKDLKFQGEKHDMKLVVLSSSKTPVKGTLVKKETSDERLLNNLDGSKSDDYPVQVVSHPTQPDDIYPIIPPHEQLNLELQTIAARSLETVDDQMTSHESNVFEKKKEDKKSTDTIKNNDSYAKGVSESDLVHPTTGIGNGRSYSNEMFSLVQNFDTCESNNSHMLPDEASLMDIHKPVMLKKEHEEGRNSSLCRQETDHGSQNLPENGLLLQSMEGLAETISNSKKLVAQVTVENIETCSSDLSDPNRKHGEALVEYPNVHNENITHEDSVDAKYSNTKPPGLLNKVSSVLCGVITYGTNTAFSGDIDDDSVLKEAQIIEARRKRIVELPAGACPAKIQKRSHWGYVLEEMTWLSNDFAQERMWKIDAAAQLSFKVAVACQLRREAKGSGMDARIVAHTLAKAVLKFWDSVLVQGTNEIVGQKIQRNEPIRAYAARLIVSHKPSTSFSQTDLPVKYARTSDLELPDFPQDHTTHEKKIYIVPPGAMETYRTSIVSHVAHIEKTRSYVQEEAEMSACDDFESQDNEYDENGGETGAFDLPAAYESSISSRYVRKKLKHLKHGRAMTSYDVGSDLLLQRNEIKLANRMPDSLAKRPGSSFNVSVPTKRVRTASRRVIGPFSAGPSGSFHLLNKADASSGDTSSLQDDLNTLRAGLIYPNTLDTDSARDFEKQSPYECAEVSMMPKIKKAKHMNDEYDHLWQADSSFHEKQRDRLKRRPKNHLLESNGNSGLFGQPMLKKPKRQSGDLSFDNPSQPGVFITSPVASQFSNMHNPNKFEKMLAGRDHSRKVKGPKMPTGQPGSGTPWSVYEDQALVVLVHDHGPNWELISDAFNSGLHFKCVFRDAKECKERHYTFMERNSSDGADSAEEPGPSQPYPSTLPGIPKGSARQLFQRLLGPVEEDSLKSHFEKIIMIGQKLLRRRSQDPKQLLQPHSSHSAALSQTFPNNLNGGPILTPLDLCDVQSPDVFSPGLQVVHTSGSGVPNQGVNNSLLPASGACSPLQGFPNMATGTNFSSSHVAVNSPARDGRHIIPRCGPLSAVDCGVRINANGSTLGVVANANRGFPIARPGLQGTTKPHGSPISRSHDPLQMIRPGMSKDSVRQIMMPDLHMSGSSQGLPHLGVLSSPVPNQTGTLPISPQQHQLHHAYLAPSPRFAKEKQMPQHMLLQQPQPQQQFPASNTSMPHVQSKPSPIQAGSQTQPQKSSPVALSSLLSPSMNSVPQHQQKRQAAAVGVVQNPQGGGSVLANHTGKHQSRQHPLRKLGKGGSNGGLILHPSVSSISNGVIASSGTQNQSLYTGSSLSSMQSFRPCFANQSPNHSVPQQKLYSGQGTSAPRNILTSKSDHSSKGTVPSANADQSEPEAVSESSLERAKSPTNRGSTIPVSTNLHDQTLE